MEVLKTELSVMKGTGEEYEEGRNHSQQRGGLVIP